MSGWRVCFRGMVVEVGFKERGRGGSRWMGEGGAMAGWLDWGKMRGDGREREGDVEFYAWVDWR